MKRGNSNNHDEDGQNVLYGDGHVEWQQNPFVGPNRDNIYTAAKDSTGVSRQPSDCLTYSSFDPNDVILAPSDP